MAYPHQTGLVVAVPLTGRSLPPQIMLTYARMAPPMNFNVRYIHSWKKPIDEARNWFAESALEWDAKWLFQMDEDVAVPAHAIRQLIFRLQNDPKAACAAGIYCQKNDKIPEPMVFRGDGRGVYWDWHAGELFECTGIGMGCSLIRVEAFKSIPKPWFLTVDDNSPTLDGENRGTCWTEDLWFCKQAREAGWRILADGGVLPDHLDLQTGVAYNLPPDSKPFQHLAIKKGAKKILDIGGGEFPLKTDEGEVVSFDLRETVNPDYRGDARRLPFDAGQFDIVYSSHVLEHFPRADIDDVLDEWCRVIKPGGELRLVLPNVAWAAQQILEGTVNDDVLNVLYGQQTYPENFHMCGFTPEIIQAHLKKRKFSKVEHELSGYNMAFRAWKAEQTKSLPKPKAKKKAKAKA